jgi:hypothetical protein
VVICCIYTRTCYFPCFAISIFDFRFLRMVLAKACHRDGIKIFIRGGLSRGVLFYEEEREGRGGFLWYDVGI